MEGAGLWTSFSIFYMHVSIKESAFGSLNSFVGVKYQKEKINQVANLGHYLQMGNIISHLQAIILNKNPNYLSYFASLAVFNSPVAASISKSSGSSTFPSLCPTKPGLAIISSLSLESTLIDSPKYKNKGTVYVPQFKINVPTSLTLYYCTKKITNPIHVIIPKEMIEMSEEYTRVTFRSPKTETTHIFGDCVLKCHPNEFVDSGYNNTYQVGIYHDSSASTSASAVTPIFERGFLKTCFVCDKSLEGDDIHIYRGEASFCSIECRFEEIMTEKHHKAMRKKMEKFSRKKENNGGNHGVIFF